MPQRQNDLREYIGRRLAPACFALAILLLTISAFSSARRSSAESDSLAMAHAMIRTFAGEVSNGVPETSRTPGYSLVIAILAQVTPGAKAALACWGTGQQSCRVMSAPMLVIAQILAAVAILLLAFRLALNLSGNAGIALIATILMFISMRLGDFAGMLRPYVWYQLFLTLYLVLSTEPIVKRALIGISGAGLVLGLAIQFEPIAIILAPITATVLLFSRTEGADRLSSAPAKAAVFFLSAVASAAVVFWVATILSYNEMSLASAVAASLSERMAFVGMGSSTSLAMSVTMIPTLGDLVSMVLPSSEIKRIAIGSVPGSLVHHGATQLLPDAMARGGGTALGAIGVLFREGLTEQPLSYLSSIPPMIVRGLFAGGGIIALVGLLHVPSMLRFARADGRYGSHLLVVVPVAALLLANALFTANPFWLNPMLPFVYAYAIAYVAAGW